MGIIIISTIKMPQNDYMELHRKRFG